MVLNSCSMSAAGMVMVELDIDQEIEVRFPLR
jgi:hypothetical protein